MSPAALAWLQRAMTALKPDVEGLSKEEYLVCLGVLGGHMPQVIEQMGALVEIMNSAPPEPPKRHLSVVP